MCSRSSDSSRTPTANVADAKRSKASAVDESGPYASPNFASNQRCTRAWLRTSTMLRSGSSKAAFTRRITASSASYGEVGIVEIAEVVILDPVVERATS